MRDSSTYLLTDSEYTTWPGALESGWAESWQHREIYQLGALLVNQDFDEITAYVQLIRPTINATLSEFSQSLTGITQFDVDRHGISFEAAFDQFMSLAEQADSIICMSGDSGVFRENCELNGLEFPFESDFHRLRPFLETQGVDLRNHSSGDLHKLTSRPIVGQTHDALHDCRSMAVWLADAKSRGVNVSIDDLPTVVPLVDPRSENRLDQS